MSNNNGQIFVSFHEWATSDDENNELPYDKADGFLHFIDKYISRAMGTHFLFLITVEKIELDQKDS